VILLDTHVLIFDALAPERLSARALAAIERGAKRGELAWADISLWETAMLVVRGRISPAVDARPFIEDMLLARRVQVLPISPEIAVLSQDPAFTHGDPADRLIAATARRHGIPLVTADDKLRGLPGVTSIW
jgi:PIN domain nuclease of toxin-antitoxin system